MQNEMQEKNTVVWRGDCLVADDFQLYESRPVVLHDEQHDKHWACLQIFKFGTFFQTSEMQGAFETIDEARDAALQMQRDFAPDPVAEERAAAEAAANAGEVSA